MGYFEAEGYKLGSTVIMTKNAFMMEKAWEDIVDSIVRGYCSMPVVGNNPQSC